MTVYEYGDTVTLTHAAAGGSDVDLLVTAPDGTESTPATSFSSPNWSASFDVEQYDQWLFTWVVDGVAVEQGSFTVGGPWYTTLALLKKSIGRRTSDTSLDDLLAMALDTGARDIEDYCDGRVFYLDDVASAREFPTDRRLCTAQGFRLPVDDIGHATITAEVGDGTTWTALTDVETYPANALAKGWAVEALISQTDWSAYRWARVTARWGWPSVPAQVKQAHQMQASRFYKRKNSPEGVTGSAEFGLIRVPNLDPDVQRLLAKFVNRFRVA